MKFSKNNNDNDNSNNDNSNDSTENKQLNSFNYLIKMPMDSVSIENVDKIMNDHDNKSKELDTIKTKKIENMWLDELKTLKQCYNEFLDESNINIQKNQKGKTKK
jgi:DNA topoisomerase-2